MRYYVTAIQFNKVAQAENRSVPSAFDDLLSARQKFHKTLADDMNNGTLGWSVVMLFDNYGNVIATERWDRPEE